MMGLERATGRFARPGLEIKETIESDFLAKLGSERKFPLA